MALSRKYSKKKTSHLSPLYYLANFLALAPPIHFNNKQLSVAIFKFKLWALAVGFMIVSTYVYCMNGTSETIFKSNKMTTTVIEIIFFLFTTAANVISVFGAAFFNMDSWFNMQRILNRIEHELPQIYTTNKHLTLHYLIIVFGNLVFGGILAFDVYINENVYGIAVYQYYLILRIQYYFIFVVVILSCASAWNIRKIFENFNEVLIKIKPNHMYVVKVKHSNSISPITLERFNNLNHVKSTTKLFTILSDLVELYNKIFGWQILILMGIVLMTLLESFNFIMVSGISGEEEMIKLFNVEKLSLSLLSTLQFLVIIQLFLNVILTKLLFCRFGEF